MEYKGYNIVPERGITQFRVKNKGSGPVPKPLSGSYTSRGTAEKAVDSYLNTLLKKGRGNGKTKDANSG